ncbi:MAG: MobF family relaxase [Sulfurimonas sp.]|uniref:MobF family relaxase n=1 Tax=Sulfurimonas sp. TaxID=2022749 RepID=UPI00261DBBA9|nr:MobF family relaxase [Sulfurimonas sp.]MDD2653377.1 MobF family relaxase [Sulfurimonas sp.]MDD3450683.1 MobF family relaxase [Sulfurimonas sp.]
MLTVRKLSMKQAATYYSKDNYYTQQIGEYYGKLKDGLSLNDLTHESFIQILQGIHPTTGESLIASKKGKEAAVPAYDFTFSPSKSVSIAYEAALAKGDTTLANAMEMAHNNAVNTALSHIESEHIKTRVQTKGKRQSINTRNMIAAKFQHDINRSLEPQLHTHSVIFNFTKSADGKYRSLDGSHLLQKGQAALSQSVGQFYREALKNELQKAGFEIRDVDKSKSFFELKNVDDNLIQAFSSRTIAIKAKVEELKKEHPHLSKSQLSLRAFFNTRQTKKEVNRDEVRHKNVELMSKHVNLDKLLSSLQPKKSARKEQIQEPKIEQAELKKIINEAKSEIQNKKHRTPLNVTIKAAAKIDTPISITTLFNQVKNEEVRQQKQLNTMHEVLLNSLKSTKLDTQKLFESLKTPNIKIQIEEKYENARGTNNRDRFITSYRDSTAELERAKQANFRDVADLTTVAERGEPRAEFERSHDVDARAARGDNSNAVTISDIRRAEELHRARYGQNQNKGVER